MEVDKSDEPEFCWGEKKGTDGNIEGLQFYESFAYDGVEYALNDFVFVYNARREDHPHIGKLLGIWETASKSKMIKVRWLFRAAEISYWLGKRNVKALENEVFLATGQGVGLEDDNDLETIDGKCCVVCISREWRNQPSTEHGQNADHVLYRSFDVGNHIISEIMDDVGGALDQVHVLSHSPKNKRNPFTEKDSIYLNVRPSKALKVEDMGISFKVKKRTTAEEPINAKGIMKDQKDVNAVKKLKTFHQYPRVGHEVHQQPCIAISIDKKGNIPPSSQSFHQNPKIGKTYEVTRRPIIEKGKWYKYNPWETENMRRAQDEKRMILLENLSPACTSREVEDLLWSAFQINCSAKMVQQTAFSSRYHGQALAILQTWEIAERVLIELKVGCLVVSGKRALTASIMNLPCLKPSWKKSKFVGHMSIDKIKHKREQKDARSTSHHSQANTIEYEFALGWCLLQSRHDLTWKRLFKHQGTELSTFVSKLRRDAKSNSERRSTNDTKKVEILE